MKIKDKGFLIFLASGLVILIVALLLNNELQVLKTEPQKPATYEEVKDGKYINYKYGFSFEDLEDVFITFLNRTPRQGYSNKLEAEFIDTAEDGYPEKYNMYLYVNDSSKEIRDPTGNTVSFVEILERPQQQLFYSKEEEVNRPRNYLKLKNIDNPNFEGYILYAYYTPSATDYEPTVSTSVYISKMDMIVSIFISSPVPKDKDIYKEERLVMLENIIDSLEFFEPRL